MTNTPIQSPWWKFDYWPQKALNGSAKFWFLTVLIGQAIFSYYIVMFYYLAIFNQDLERFNQVMPAGHIDGDTLGNFAVMAHVFFAAIITVGGLLQLFPMIRKNWPSLHRWNGRIYVMVAMIMSLSGMVMIITRYEKIVGNIIGHASIMINSFIIIVTAIMAFKHARQRQFHNHRTWALRLFVAVSGVWMFRIGLMAWLSIHGKPVGFNPATLTGPFISILYVMVYIVPLMLLELYFRSQISNSGLLKITTALTVSMISGIFTLGVFAATMGMWLPRM